MAISAQCCGRRHKDHIIAGVDQCGITRAGHFVHVAKPTRSFRQVYSPVAGWNNSTSDLGPRTTTDTCTVQFKQVPSPTRHVSIHGLCSVVARYLSGTNVEHGWNHPQQPQTDGNESHQFCHSCSASRVRIPVVVCFAVRCSSVFPVFRMNGWRGLLQCTVSSNEALFEIHPILEVSRASSRHQSKHHRSSNHEPLTIQCLDPHRFCNHRLKPWP